MKRFVELDVLRGVLLLMMVVNHSPSSLRRFTDQPLGFFTTAECFVFVSAFLAGMVFRKRAQKLGFAAARSSSIQRAGRIYRAHLVTLFFAFVLGSFFSMNGSAFYIWGAYGIAVIAILVEVLLLRSHRKTATIRRSVSEAMATLITA